MDKEYWTKRAEEELRNFENSLQEKTATKESVLGALDFSISLSGAVVTPTSSRKEEIISNKKKDIQKYTSQLKAHFSVSRSVSLDDISIVQNFVHIVLNSALYLAKEGWFPVASSSVYPTPPDDEEHGSYWSPSRTRLHSESPRRTRAIMTSTPFSEEQNFRAIHTSYFDGAGVLEEVTVRHINRMSVDFLKHYSSSNLLWKFLRDVADHLNDLNVEDQEGYMRGIFHERVVSRALDAYEHTPGTPDQPMSYWLNRICKNNAEPVDANDNIHITSLGPAWTRAPPSNYTNAPETYECLVTINELTETAISAKTDALFSLETSRVRLFHGTTGSSAIYIRRDGILFNRCSSDLDFGPQAFYTSPNAFLCAQWAQKAVDKIHDGTGYAALVIYDIMKKDWEKLNRMNFVEADINWKVHVCKARKSIVMEVLDDFDLVQGPILSNPPSRNTNLSDAVASAVPLEPVSRSIQCALLSTSINGRKLFNRCIRGILFFRLSSV